MILTSLFVLFMLLPVPAKFVTKPEKFVTVYKSRDILIKCDIFGYPTPEVKWRRSPKNLSVDRHVLSGNKLTIKNTTEEDKGVYTCWGIQQLDREKIITNAEFIMIDVEDVGKLRIVIKRKCLRQLKVECSSRFITRQ